VPAVLAHDISHAQIGNAMHVANVGVAMLVALSSLARVHTASPDQFLPPANPNAVCIADVKPDGVTWDPELEAWTVAMPEFHASFKASKYASQSHAENAANHFYTTMKTTIDQVAKMIRKDLMTKVAALGHSRLSRCNKPELGKLYLASVSQSLQPAEPDSNPQCHDPVSAALPDDSVFEDVTHVLFTNPAIVQHVQQEDIKQKRQNVLVLPAAVAEAFVHHCASVPRSFGFLLGKNPGIVKKNILSQTKPPAYRGLVHPRPCRLRPGC